MPSRLLAGHQRRSAFRSDRQGPLQRVTLRLILFVRDSEFSYTYLGFAQKNGHVAVRLGEKSEAASRAAVEKLRQIPGACIP